MIILEMLFIKVLYASITASFLIILVLLAKKLLNFRLSPKLHHGLWLLVLVRLLVPIMPESPTSIFNVVPQVGYTVAGYVDNIIENGTSKNSFSADNQSQTPLNNVVNAANTNNITNNANQKKLFTKEINLKKDMITATTEKITLKQIIVRISACLWLIIFMSLIIYNLIFTFKFKKRVKTFNLVANSAINSTLDKCKHKLKIKKDILIYATNNSCSPFVGGILKPKIYLSADVLEIIEEKQLTHILLHELVHYKRKDLFYNFLSIAGITVHWFNPLVWLAMKKMKADREIACDAYVLETLGEDEATEYGMTLIKLSRVSKLNHMKLSPVTFYESKSQLERRILMINKFKNGTNKLSALTVALCLVVSSITLTNAATTNVEATLNKSNINSSSFKIYDFRNSKIVYNLNRANEFTNTKFKVPDYLPEGTKFESLDIRNKVLDNEDIISVHFLGKPSIFGTVEISKGNLLNKLLDDAKRFFKYYKGTVNKQPMTISHINGTSVTVHKEYKKGDWQGDVSDFTTEENEKYFTWQDEGVWYSIQYYMDDVMSSKKTSKVGISDSKLQQIVQSFKYQKDIKNVSYSVKNPYTINIYDESDLISAKKLMGTELFIPSSIPGGLILTSATVTGASSIKERVLRTFYNKNFENSIANPAVEVQVIQSNLANGVYSSMKKKGYAYTPEYIGSNKYKKVSAKILHINGVDVFTYDNGDYMWEKNKFYYTALIPAEECNVNKVLSALIK
jgi:bla regulator protein BlaR1